MTEGENLAVEFSLNAAVYEDYTKLVLPKWTKWLFRLGGVSFFIFALNDALMSWGEGDGFLTWNLVVYTLVAVFLLFFPFFSGFIARWRFYSKAFEKVRAPMHIEISPQGIYSRGGMAESRTPWSSIIDMKVTPVAAYFFIMKNIAHIVPRHAFADAAGFERFVSAARAWWKPGGAAEKK
jgi:hypothetical protein